MNKLYIFLIIYLAPLALFAQKKHDFVFREMQDVKVDGDLEDWNGKLYNEDSDLWSFAISKGSDKMFVAVRIKDEMLQREALRNGIFVNLSYDSKKKDGAKLVFPYVDRERLRALSQDEDRKDDNVKNDLLKSVRGYWIMGFSKVVDGLLSFDNMYGIRAFVQMHESGELHYESEIPLDLIKFKENRVAVQIGINTHFSQIRKIISNNTQPQNVRIYGAASTPPPLKNPYKEDTSVWIFGNIK